MRRILKLGIIAVLLLTVSPKHVAAQAKIIAQPITFNKFTAIYHLSRDADNHSLLTTEEVILADFPGTTNYYGITRAIPKNYQGRSVKIKVNSVTDAAGSPVPFKTASDKDGNLVVTTGDPDITLYGSQTFRISYQTRDVINTTMATDQFLLNTNGRGWNQAFGQVSAIVHIPKVFSSNLLPHPSCYIGSGSKEYGDCSITTEQKSDETIITAKSAGSVAAKSSLILKIGFKASTFQTSKEQFYKKLLPVGVIILISLPIVARIRRNR